jgi:hypothetical protein
MHFMQDNQEMSECIYAFSLGTQVPSLLEPKGTATVFHG